MLDEDRLPLLAKTSDMHMNRLLVAYKPLIMAQVTRIFHAVREDHLQAGMEAVMEAAFAFDPEKGVFGALAKRVLASRLTDIKRREIRHKEAPLSELPEERREMVFAAASRQAHDMLEETAARKQELLAYAQTLGKLGITLPDMQKSAPSHERTRASCKRCIDYLLRNEDARAQTLEGRLPIARLREAIGEGDKFFERHRRYLVGTLVALDGDYPHIQSYIKGGGGQ